jgi:hypothetical protein
MGSIITLNEAIIRAKAIHGDKYDYSRSIYLGQGIPFEIGCNKCGQWFWQTPKNHWLGAGCNQICLRNRKHLARNKGLEQFICEAISLYGDLYDYSEFIYVNRHTRGTIICRVLDHGRFEKTPGHHLFGQGCPKCSGRYRRTLSDFIKDAILVHGPDRYDYSMAIYTNAHGKLIIICNQCNLPFSQRAEHHLNGVGCPNCCHTISRMEIEWLNYLGIPQENRQVIIKIGTKRYMVDGRDPINPMILYEFNGDFWHGNPVIYNTNDINRVTKTTFGELYNKTLEKKILLEGAGYTVISIWENEWEQFVLNKIA